MAKVKKEVVATYVLTLTADEAQVLRDILAHISGDPDVSRRGLTMRIRDALHAAGLYPKPMSGSDITGVIGFTPKRPSKRAEEEEE